MLFDVFATSGWFVTPTHFLQQNPHKDPIIVLHDINTASLRTLLTFMYNGEVNVTEEFLPVLLKTAETLRICGLSTGSETSKDEEVRMTKSSAGSVFVIFIPYLLRYIFILV